MEWYVVLPYLLHDVTNCSFSAPCVDDRYHRFEGRLSSKLYYYATRANVTVLLQDHDIILSDACWSDTATTSTLEWYSVMARPAKSDDGRFC